MLMNASWSFVVKNGGSISKLNSAIEESNKNEHFFIKSIKPGLNQGGDETSMLVQYTDVAFIINYHASRNVWDFGFLRNSCSINVEDRSERVDLTFFLENLLQFRDQTVETEKKKLIKFLTMNNLYRQEEGSNDDDDDCSRIQLSNRNYSFECNKDTLKWSLVYKQYFYSYGVTKNEIVHNDIHRMMRRLKERYSEWMIKKT